MSTQGVPSATWNPWKWAAIGMALLLMIVVIGGVIMARHLRSASPQSEPESVAEIPPNAGAPPVAQQPQTGVPAQPPAAIAPVQPRAVVPPVPPVPPNPAVPRRHSLVPRGSVRAGDVPVAQHLSRPSQGDIEACRRYASNGSNPAADALTGALVGGVAGAGLGAAGGAIADGGNGAGKGAAIGGLVGATTGTLFGLSQANQRDARIAAAYHQCMRQRGYVD